jgi:Domain of unknown function (DUF4062)/Tetratricopeptide repeat/NB-ARC domain
MKTGQVFVSHTSDMACFPEGRSFVQAALDAVSRAEMAPVDMRYFAARDSRPADYCRQRVRRCEIYVAVVGFRYGSLVPGEDVSYTELEFQAAGDAGLPRLAFLLEETACPAGLAGADSGQVTEFRHRLLEAGLMVRGFTSGDGLELEVFHALRELASTSMPVGPAGFISLGTPAGATDGRGASAAVRQVPAPRGHSGSGKARLSGTVPRIWSVPNRNADFTGRREILARLHDELAGDGKAVVLARALYGMGGVGKTQVALEYAHRFKADYDLIWWIPAEQPQEISLALAELAARLGLQTSDNATEAAAVALEELRRDADTVGRWLLIFDNAEDPADLEAFLPTGSGHVVITSRNQAWTRQAQPVELDVFSRQESIAHLTRHVPGLDLDDAAKVSAAVGDLPLAIEQAGAWLAETGMAAASYVEWLATRAASALGLNKPLGYATPVAATWNLSLSRLRKRSPAAVRLLQILAFCSPGPISMTLLYGDEMIVHLLPFDEKLRDKYMLGQVIRDISTLALARIDPGSNSLQIHRLVQLVIRAQMTEEEQRRARHEVHVVLAGARPRQGETDDPANWSTYDLIWSHLGPSQADECDDPRTRQLLIDWVRYQWKLGEFESGLSLARRLENLWTRHLGPDHQQTLHLQFQIANLLRAQGHFGESRDLDSYVLERQRATLGSDHLYALMTANGLGADLRAIGDFQESLALDQETYESFKEKFGPDYPRTLAAAHNLGCSLRLIGDCFTARRLDEETLSRQRQVLGRDHPYTLLSAASLAHDLREAGAFRDSADLLRDTWGKYREILGDDMVDTLRAATSLIASLRKTGEQAEAMALALDTYGRYKRRYGSDAPDGQRCALNLACVCAAADDMPRALDLVTKVKAAHQANLGNDHPNTLVAANNLACYLRCTGQLGEALALADDTLCRMQRKLGDHHPLTLSCAANLANCRSDSGDHETAEALQRQTISLQQEILGQDHPDTLVCQANLAVTLRQAGHDEEAEQIRTQILDILSQVLGPQHPDTMLLKNWRHINRDLESPQF